MSRFIPDPTPVYTPEWKDRPDAELIVFCGRDMLLCPHENRYEFPRSADLRHWNIHAALRIGMCDGKPCYAVELPELPEAAFPEQEWQQKGEPFPTQKLRLLCSPAFSDYGTGASLHPRLCKLPFFCTHDPTINCIIA